MLDYTKAAFNKIIADFKLLGFIFGLAVQIFNIAYLVYSLIFERGVYLANIILLFTSSIYFIYYVITHGKIDKSYKRAKRRIRRVYVCLKLLIKAYSLGVILYSIYFTAVDVTVLSVVFTALMIISWLMQIFFEILRYVIESRCEIVMTGITIDVNKIKKPFSKAKEILSFKKKNQIEDEEKPSKAFRILEKKVLKAKEEKKKANKDKKAM